MSKTLDLEAILTPDALGCKIADHWRDWNNRRQNWISEKEEIQKYVFATDTRKTANATLPWSNTTTIPKLCQIRDNLFANYMATMFPKRKNIVWEGSNEEDNAKAKVIEAYMSWVVDFPEYYNEVAKLVLDYIDYGNCFAMPEWVDGRNRATDGDKDQYGYVGPRLRRISPLDIVFNPVAPTFKEAPKIVRSIVSIGEIKEILEREAKTDEERKDAEVLLAYMKEIRHRARTVGASSGDTMVTQNAIYQISGFDSYYAYLMSNTVEILTFYGDIYIEETDSFERNQIIKVIDRHKLVSQRPNPSFFGHAPIYHVGWRIRPDNLWAMGPLDNLVGMQYRIDHLENMKADIWDLTRYPVFAVMGDADDFDWTPGEKIFLDREAKIELLSPDVGALQANTEIAILEQKMEEMAGSPKEAMGFRTPGEKTKYEVQRLENAASRIFQNKINQFERHGPEEWLNAMLELARRYMKITEVPAFNEEFQINTFLEITPEEITGQGRIKPMAARHFAEQAQMVQDLNAFFGSAAGQDPLIRIHWSSTKLARMWENLLDVEDYGLVQPYIGITEQQEAQQMQMVAQENAMVTARTASGIGSDYDLNQAEMASPSFQAGPEGEIPQGGPGLATPGGNPQVGGPTGPV